MDKPQGTEIPIHRDHRTFEQQRCDLVNNLDKKYRNKHEDLAVNETRHTHLVSTDWPDEVRRWIDLTNKWWSHDRNRMWRNMFSLVPTDRVDMDPLSAFDIYGAPTYVPSILSRMDRQMRALRENLEKLIPDYTPDLIEQAERGYQGALIPRGGLSDALLGYLTEAYEPDENGQLQIKLRFDLRDFDPDDINVETAKHWLTVHARKTIEMEGITETREFCRTLYLPDKVDEDKFTSHLSQDGILTVSVPVRQTEVGTIKYDRERQLSIQPYSGTTELALKPIGKPGTTVLAEGTGCDRLHVEIPVEPGFRSEDLYVSTVGKQLLVSGMRESEEEFGECGKSVHVLEFRRTYPIPSSVDPLSLQAQLCDNTLVVEAPLVHEPK